MNSVNTQQIVLDTVGTVVLPHPTVQLLRVVHFATGNAAEIRVVDPTGVVIHRGQPGGPSDRVVDAPQIPLVLTSPLTVVTAFRSILYLRYIPGK